MKPRRSAAGHGIRFWDGEEVDQRHYLQEFIEGRSISGVFFADDGGCRFLGASGQIIGDPKFGTHHFRYAGSVGPIGLSEGQRRAFEQLGEGLVQRFGLRGPLGVDAILDKAGVIWPVEVNPRYTASMEVLERATGAIVLAGTHGAASGQVVGKAIVYAREDCRVGDLYEQFAAEKVADVPETGQTFHRGEPICTLFASGGDETIVLQRLHRMAEDLYTRLLP